MIFSIFAPTYNFFCQASSTDARRFNRWAFFMPLSLILGLSYSFLSAAYLEWYLYIRISISRLAKSCTLAVKRAAVFFALNLTYNSIMSNPQLELQKVHITPAQKSLLDFITHASAKSVATHLLTLNMSACDADCPDVESIEQVMQLAKIVYEVALEGKALQVPPQ